MKLAESEDPDPTSLLELLRTGKRRLGGRGETKSGTNHVALHALDV